MLGERLKFARKAAGLRQSEAAEALGIRKSGISDMEKDHRHPKAAQLAKLAELYRRPMDFFFSDQPLQEDFVLWRCKPKGEAEAKGIQRKFFELCENYSRLEKLTGLERRSGLPDCPEPEGEYTYQRAECLALTVGQGLSLGIAPARVLKLVLEESCNVRIFGLQMRDSTSALCMRHERLGDCVLLNQNNVNWRRNFDLAHELFHLLTWRFFRRTGDTTADVATPQEESFADAFASRLLLPESPFCERLFKVVKNGQLKFVDVHELAREFDVSAEAVIYRIAGLSRWRKEVTAEVVSRVKDLYVPRENPPADSLPRRYSELTILAYRRGLVSFGRAAKYLKRGYREAKGILEPPEDEFDLDTPIPAAAD